MVLGARSHEEFRLVASGEWDEIRGEGRGHVSFFLWRYVFELNALGPAGSVRLMLMCESREGNGI